MEFYRAAYRALTPGGLFVVNVGDVAGLPRARATVAGLQEVFANTAATFTGRGDGNVVVAASDAPLPDAQLPIDGASPLHD